MQDDITQYRAVMRGEWIRTAPLWAPHLPLINAFAPVAIHSRVDLGDAPSQEADSEASGLPRK